MKLLKVLALTIICFIFVQESSSAKVGDFQLGLATNVISPSKDLSEFYNLGLGANIECGSYLSEKVFLFAYLDWNILMSDISNESSSKMFEPDGLSSFYSIGAGMRVYIWNLQKQITPFISLSVGYSGFSMTYKSNTVETYGTRSISVNTFGLMPEVGVSFPASKKQIFFLSLKYAGNFNFFLEDYMFDEKTMAALEGNFNYLTVCFGVKFIF